MDFSIISQLSDYRDAYTLKYSKLIHNFCNNHLIPGYYNTVALIFQMTVLQYLFSFLFFCGALNKMIVEM